MLLSSEALRDMAMSAVCSTAKSARILFSAQSVRTIGQAAATSGACS